MSIISLILFILILGLIVLVHEFGHFICAKKSGVYIYEFSIGMGPKIFSHKGKDGIYYNIRALPIGGFVQMAGEVYEDDSKIPKEKFMCNKPWYQRLAILVAGVFNNFLLGLLFLFIGALIWGPTSNIAKIKDVQENSAAAVGGLQVGDTILSINHHDFKSWDVGQIYLYYKNDNNEFIFKVKRANGDIEEVTVSPTLTKDEKGNDKKVFGITIDNSNPTGVWESLKYTFRKFGDIISSMWITVGGLITGQISVKNLSGPVGIYEVVDQSVQYGARQIVYLVSYLSINVGFINILPFPAFDGGYVFFMIIEKIRRKKISPKFESTCTIIGFTLLMILMVLVTIQDIIRLF